MRQDARGLTRGEDKITIYGEKAYINPIDEFKTNAANHRKLPEMRKDFNLREVHETYHEIARRIVLGQKTRDIANDLNISTLTVSNARNSPIIKDQIRIMGGARDYETKNIAKQIRDLAPKCVEVLEGILDDDEAGKALKVKTSLAILDRAGHSVPKNVNVKGVHAVVTSADLDRIKARAAEIGIEEETIDV